MASATTATQPSIDKNFQVPLNSVNVSGYDTQEPGRTISSNTNTPPNKAPTTHIAYRVIKCAGKILLSVFTVPAVAILEALVGCSIGIAICYHKLVLPGFKNNSICLLLLTPVICLTFVAPTCASAGFFSGMATGAKIAYECSADSTKQLTNYLGLMKNAWLGLQI